MYEFWGFKIHFSFKWMIFQLFEVEDRWDSERILDI